MWLKVHTSPIDGEGATGPARPQTRQCSGSPHRTSVCPTHRHARSPKGRRAAAVAAVSPYVILTFFLTTRRPEAGAGGGGGVATPLRCAPAPAPVSAAALAISGRLLAAQTGPVQVRSVERMWKGSFGPRMRAKNVGGQVQTNKILGGPSRTGTIFLGGLGPAVQGLVQSGRQAVALIGNVTATNLKRDSGGPVGPGGHFRGNRRAIYW